MYATKKFHKRHAFEHFSLFINEPIQFIYIYRYSLCLSYCIYRYIERIFLYYIIAVYNVYKYICILSRFYIRTWPNYFDSSLSRLSWCFFPSFRVHTILYTKRELIKNVWKMLFNVMMKSWCGAIKLLFHVISKRKRERTTKIKL